MKTYEQSRRYEQQLAIENTLDLLLLAVLFGIFGGALLVALVTGGDLAAGFAAGIGLSGASLYGRNIFQEWLQKLFQEREDGHQ